MKSNAAGKKLRMIIFSSLMIALSVVLGYISIDVAPNFKISLANVPVMFTGMVLGPIFGLLVGIITDVLNFILKPSGPFHFGFTLTNGLYGFLPGLFYLFLKKKASSFMSIKNIAVTVFVTEFIGSVVLYTYFLSSLYGGGFIAMLPIRLLKGIVMALIQTVIIYILFNNLNKTKYFN